MSSPTTESTTQSASSQGPATNSHSTPKKKNGNKKKKNANKQQQAKAAPPPVDETENNDGPDDDDVPHEQPAEQEEATAAISGQEEHSAGINESNADTKVNGHAGTNGTHERIPTPTTTTTTTTAPETSSARLEAMSQEREALRVEVEELRRQLEDMQSTHDAEVSQLKTELEESEAAKEHAETQYQKLVERVEKIKETLGERLKRDRAELDEARDRIEELEAQRDESRTEISRLQEETQEQARELASLRSRTNLSQQNWLKEKEDLAKQVQHLRAELESTSGAMGEWEVIAMEERSVREALAEKEADLEEQLAATREAYARAAEERDTQSQAVDGLQRALREIQEARKKELREMVETAEEQLQQMKKRTQEADQRATAAEEAKVALEKELQRTAPFEKEVKEKNLLIGKLRHEAIVLNDHLTKALKYIKKTKPEETIDRQIVTNHFLQFLSLDRSDPKKFQILQVIAGLLNWTDEQREQAGLARPGGGGGSSNNHSLRLPVSPFHRTPSSPALNQDFFSEPMSAASNSGKESLADLWAGFLERSVEEAGAGETGGGSRKDSMSSVTTTTTAATRPDTRGHS
ncbi:Golgi matrix protein [Diplogelasinospora grovesii]|uniref:Golgi matrix protein n=1 Tax=Diplogelasinospora grovesii TaxID=303347 RepID=A0AAN6NJT3_9PEZI|nr:Golgi matrix protein [Diplogelasinospora grovesii]